MSERRRTATATSTMPTARRMTHPLPQERQILGNRQAVLRFLFANNELTRAQNFQFADQGTLNYLAHTGRLNACGRIKVVQAGQSVVNNCGFTEIDLLEKKRHINAEEREQIAFIPRDQDGRLGLCRDHNGWVLDDDGNISYVVHQYDRFVEMYEFVDQLADQLRQSFFAAAADPDKCTQFCRKWGYEPIVVDEGEIFETTAVPQE